MTLILIIKMGEDYAEKKWPEHIRRSFENNRKEWWLAQNKS